MIVEFAMNHQWIVAPLLVGAAFLLVHFTNRDPKDGYEN